MNEIMSKNTGIDSQSFYGNQSNVKRNVRKNKQMICDENQIPDKKKLLNASHNQTYGTPPKRYLSSTLNSTEKFYYSTIQPKELNLIENGFNRNSLSGSKPRKNYSQIANSGLIHNPKETNTSLKSVHNIKVNMKLSIETTPKDMPSTPNTNSSELRTQKITHYFASKQKSPFVENNDLNENQKTQQMNSEVISPISCSVDNEDKCQTPKYWKQNKSLDSVHKSSFNSRLFGSESNDFNETNNNNNITDTQTPIYIDCYEMNVLEANTPIGLRNLGNTCYMNSIVQSLFSLKFFIEDLDIKFNELKICENSTDFSMTENLLNLYNRYNGLRNRVEKCSLEDLNSDLSDLKQCVGQKSSPFLGGSQQDAAEFFNYVIDTIAEEFESCQKSEPKNNPIWRNFSFETGGTLVCEKCHSSTHLPNERFNALYLSIPEDNSLQTAFDHFLKDETTEHQCGRCGANRNILSKYFAKRPKVLFLQLARYTQDGSKRTEQVLVPQVIHLTVQKECLELIAPSPLATPYRTKLENMLNPKKTATVVRKITFNDENNEHFSNGFDKHIEMHTNENNNNWTDSPSQLDLQQSIEEITEPKVNKSTDRVKYQLMAVVCHHGITLSVGHYTSFVYSIENNKWFECDDNRITETDFNCVEKRSQTSGYCYFYVLS